MADSTGDVYQPAKRHITALPVLVRAPRHVIELGNDMAAAIAVAVLHVQIAQNRDYASEMALLVLSLRLPNGESFLNDPKHISV